MTPTGRKAPGESGSGGRPADGVGEYRWSTQERIFEALTRSCLRQCCIVPMVVVLVAGVVALIAALHHH